MAASIVRRIAGAVAVVALSSSVAACQGAGEFTLNGSPEVAAGELASQSQGVRGNSERCQAVFGRESLGADIAAQATGAPLGAKGHLERHTTLRSVGSDLAASITVAVVATCDEGGMSRLKLTNYDMNRVASTGESASQAMTVDVREGDHLRFRSGVIVAIDSIDPADASIDYRVVTH